MWTRLELKDQAKQTLRKYYWMAFLVVLVASILGGTQTAGFPRLEFNFNSGDWNNLVNNDGFWQEARGSGNILDYPGAVWALLFGSAVLSGAFLGLFSLGVAIRVFLGGPVEVGMSRYFLEARQDRSEFTNLFYSFKSGRYMNAVKANAWRLLFTFLWTLLFIIPGIVKGYAYSMIPYLMADNPGMGYRRAMELSMAMTNGEKMNIFVLDLSFIGWYLLGLLACCIGVIFVNPYFYATKAELYAALRQKALDANLCTAEEVGLA